MTYDDFRIWVSEATKVPLEQVHEHTSFSDELGIDSLQMVNILVACSLRFQFDLGAVASLEEMQTVGKMYHTMTKGK
jgi:acyl carrier protein